MLPLIFAASLLAPAVAAASEGRQLVTRGDGFIRSPVNAIPDPSPRLLLRQNSVDVQNHDAGTKYAIEIEVGTPPQEITLIIDTGSPDTWLNPSCATAGSSGQISECRASARFDPNKSSSINATEYGDVLRYGKGNATIQYVHETLTIGCMSPAEQTLDARRTLTNPQTQPRPSRTRSSASRRSQT